MRAKKTSVRAVGVACNFFDFAGPPDAGSDAGTNSGTDASRAHADTGHAR
jgi:hypothetical protein